MWIQSNMLPLLPTFLQHKTAHGKLSAKSFDFCAKYWQLFSFLTDICVTVLWSPLPLTFWCRYIFSPHHGLFQCSRPARSGHICWREAARPPDRWVCYMYVILTMAWCPLTLVTLLLSVCSVPQYITASHYYQLWRRCLLQYCLGYRCRWRWVTFPDVDEMYIYTRSILSK